MQREKQVRLCYFKKDGKIIEGFYRFVEPNTWKAVVYFRKPKGVSQKEYEEIINLIK